MTPCDCYAASGNKRDAKLRNQTLRDLLALTLASFFPLVMAILYFVVLANPADETNRALLAAFGIGKAIQFTG